MSLPAGAYEVEIGDVAVDRERILALWRDGLAQNGMPEAKFDWYYRGNPEGPPAVLFLRVPGAADPVGVAALGRRRLRRGGTSLEAGALADFVVAASHRSFFPALFLQRAMRMHAASGRAAVFGLPNAQSEAVVRRAGYRRVGDSIRHVRVVRSGDYFSRHLPAWIAQALGPVVDGARHAAALMGVRSAGGFRARWQESVPAGVDALWERAIAPAVAVGVRDARFLAWRFAQCPLYRYRFLALEEESSGRLAAYAVCLERGHTLEVSDFLVDPGARGAASRVWGELAIEAYRRGHRSASVEFLGGAAVHATMESAGWVARDRRALYAALADEAALGDAECWYLTPADEDA